MASCNMEVFTVIIWCSVFGVGICSDDLRIIDGSEAEQFKYPFIVSIKYDNQHICGGFVYNARFVVTTAACIKDKDIGRMNVVGAEYDSEMEDLETEQRKPIKALYPYESYNETLQLDNIALVETSNAFDLSNVSYVTFGIYDEFNKSGNLTAKFLGWGGSNQNFSAPTSILQETLLDIHYPPVASCSEVWNASFVPSMMLCVGPNRGSYPRPGYPCKYDEGSPLLQLPDERIVGIMSQNKGCDPDISRLQVPTLFTRISPYYAWLQRTAGPQPT